MSLSIMATSGITGYIDDAKSTVNNASSTISGYSKGITSLANSGKNLYNTASSVIKSSDNLMSGGGWNDSSGNFLTGDYSGYNVVYDFLSNFREHGFMRQNRFRAEFTLPMGVNDNSTSTNTFALSSNIRNAESGLNGNGAINVKCHTVTFPTRSLDTFKFRTNSAEFRVPHSTSYEPITISFYVNGEMDSRQYFELWQSAVMNFGDNTMNFYSEYVSDVKLYLQDEHGNDTYAIILYECYPSAIMQFDVGFSHGATVLSIQVTLSYKSWLPMSNNSNTSEVNRTV